MLADLQTTWAKGPASRGLICLAMVALLIQFLVQLSLARLDSQTTDEAVHLSAGYTYLTQADFRFNPEHPPLIKLLAALPLLVLKPNVSAEAIEQFQRSSNFFYDSWRENRIFGADLLYNSGNNADQLLFWGRLPIVLLTLLLGMTIFGLALRHWGERAALVATLLYAFDPTVNGHGHLVTTDTAIALGFLLATYSFWHLLAKPTWRQALLCGLATGFALLTKHTAIILLPAFIAMAGMYCLVAHWPGWRTLWPKLVLVVVTIWVMIWAGFGFHDRLLPATDHPSTDARTITAQLQPNLTADQLPQPNHLADTMYQVGRYILLPGDYIKGVTYVVAHVAGGHDSYLLGQVSKTGWWYYFPVLLITKEPLPTLILLLAAVIGLVIVRPKNNSPLLPATAAAVFLVVAMSSKADLGIRHIMPTLPLMMIAAGWAAAQFRHWWLPALALLIWLAILFGLSFPTYLGYFNPVAGGSANGYKVAVDSNLDWGQDIKRLHSYLNAHPQLEPIYIEYGWDEPGALRYYLGNQYQPLSFWQAGQPGMAIIGASAYATGNWAGRCIAPAFITNGLITCTLK